MAPPIGVVMPVRGDPQLKGPKGPFLTHFKILTFSLNIRYLSWNFLFAHPPPKHHSTHT